MSERNKRIRSETQSRAFVALDRKLADPEARTVPASLSSESEYERWFGREVLVHEEDAIDLTRAAGESGLPLLYNHDHNAIVGRIKNVRLVDGVLRGMLVFGNSAKASEIWDDVRDGILTDTSIGYRIQKWEETQGEDLVRVTRWQPYEASVVTVPADFTVGINRSMQQEDETMSEKTDGQQTEPGGQQTAGVRRDFRIAHAAGAKEATKLERERVRAIDDIFEEIDDAGRPLVPATDLMRAIRAKAIDEGWNELATRREVMRAQRAAQAQELPDLSRHSDETLGLVHEPQRGGQPQHVRVSDVRMGETETEKLAKIAEKAIMVRAGVEQDREIAREVRASGFHDWSAFDLGMEMLRRSNVPTSGFDKKRLAGVMLGRAGAHTNADFPSILANVATKSALRGWNEAPTTWQMWCNIGSLPDFKAATIAGLGGFPDLDTIPRSGGPYLEHSMDDVHETAQLATYGALFSIGRQTLIDDDLGAFTRIPMQMGAAAARKVNMLAYDRLVNGTSETLTQDSTALFDASTHANYVTSGAAPSTTTLDAGFVAMAKQKAPTRTGETSSAYLNISPAYLIVPRALETTSRVLVTSAYDPAGTTASISRRDAPNPFQGRLEVVSDAYLDGSGITAGWYLAAARNSIIETVTVFFLNGQSEPYLEEADHAVSSDGVTYKVRIDAAAKALDFRGLYYNDGA